MRLDFFKNIDKEEIKLRLKNKWTDWQMYQSLALIIGAVFVCLIIASLINLYYPKDWTIERSVMDNEIFKAIWIILLGLHFVFFCIQQFKFEYRYSKIQYLILGYSGVIYLTLRIVEFKTKRLEIYPIYPDGWLTYLDISFVLLVLSLFFSMFRDMIPLKKKPVTNIFLEDNPLCENEDLTQFDNLLKQIEPALFKDRYNNAFSIGIIGPWGSGKSSFIKAVEKRIKSKGDAKTLYISFSPFLNHNEDRVIHEFFIQLSNELKKRSGKLSNLLLNYSAKLSNAIKDGNPISFLKPSGLTKEAESVGELYDEIEKVIHSLNLKIIVSIDDLDRLNSKEIIQVLKLIRNTSNFPNVVFLVAMDKEYVLSVLNNEKSLNFLNKFFQLEINLFATPKNNLLSMLWFEINTRLDKADLKRVRGMNDIRTEIENNVFLHNHINSYRDLKRFVNQFLLDFKLVNDVLDSPDVGPIDIVNLTILKLNYPSLFNLLRQGKYHDLGINEVRGYLVISTKIPNNNADFNFSMESVKEFDFAFNEDQTKIKILKEEYPIQTAGILLKLFGVVSESYLSNFTADIYQNSVRNSDVLRYYFQKIFPNDVVSSEQFMQYYELSVLELKKILKESENPVLYGQIEKRISELTPENEPEWKKKLEFQLLFFEIGTNVINFLAFEIEKTIIDLRKSNYIYFKNIIYSLFNSNESVDLYSKRLFLNLKLSMPDLNLVKEQLNREFQNLIKFKLESDLNGCFEQALNLMKFEKSDLLKNEIRNVFRDKVQTSEGLELEQIIIKNCISIDHKYDIPKEYIRLFGSLQNMRSDMEMTGVNAVESELIELINVQLAIQETKVDFKFKWSNDNPNLNYDKTQYFCLFVSTEVYDFLRSNTSLSRWAQIFSWKQQFFTNNNALFLKLEIPNDQNFMRYIEKIAELLKEEDLLESGARFFTDGKGNNITVNKKVVMSTFSEQFI